jgi:uncharacterized protein
MPILEEEMASSAPPRSYREAAPQLQLSLTDACNLSCSYCSFRQRIGGNGKPVNMPLSRAKEAIQFFRENTPEDMRSARFDFGLAGEPLLRHKVHGELVSFIQDTFGDSADLVGWAGTNTTNATLIEDAALFEAFAPPMDLSIDGPKDVHDRMRPFVDGRGSFDDVIAVAKKGLARHPDIGCSAVLTAYETDFVRIFRFLHEEIGFSNIYMKPVNVTRDVEYGLNEETVHAFKAGYTGLIDYISSLPNDRMLRALLSLSRDDYFMRFFYRTKERAVLRYRCGAGKSGAYVDTDGKLYACAHFMGKQGWDIGNIDDGFDREKVRQFEDLTVDSREPCASCRVKYRCGGGCYYQAVLVNGALDKPDEAKCDLIRHLCDLADTLLARLQASSPEVLWALPQPYFIDEANTDAEASRPFVPLASFGEAHEGSAAVQMNSAPKIQGRLSSEIGQLSLQIRGGEDLIHFEFAGGVEQISSVELDVYGAKNLPTYDDLVVPRDARRLDVIRLDVGRKERVAEIRIIDEHPTIRRVPYRSYGWGDLADCAIDLTSDRLIFAVPKKYLRNVEQETGYINITIKFIGGGESRLTRFEPFISLPLGVHGILTPYGGEFADQHGDISVINPILGAIPITRWQSVDANVC